MRTARCFTLDRPRLRLDRWQDRKCLWPPASSPNFPHLPISGLDVSRQARRIKQRTRPTVPRQSSAQRRAQIAVTGDPQRKRLVVLKRSGRQIWHSDRMQQASRNPARERCPGTGNDRQPRPQGIAGSRMRVVRQRVRNRSARRCRAKWSGSGNLGANTSRSAATPRFAASRASPALAQRLSSNNQSTLPGTASSSRIQMSNRSGVIFAGLLKQQKTKPPSGSPHAARDGVSPEIGRRSSLH